MTGNRNILLFAILYIGLLITFILFFENYQEKQIQKEMDYHSQSVSNALWELHMIRLTEYLELAAHDKSCAVIEIYDNYSEDLILRALAPDQTGLVNLLIAARLIGQREYEVPIIYMEEVIGKLRMIRYNKNIFTHGWAFFLLFLLYIATILLMNLLKAREDLEYKVRERTADLQKEVDSRKKAEEDLNVVLNSIGDAVMTVDKNGLILTLNRKAEELSGWSAKDAFRRSVDKIFPLRDDLTDRISLHPVGTAIESGETVTIASPPLLTSREGHIYRIYESVSPVLSPMREIIGAVIVLRDITVEFEVHHRLQQSRKMEALGQLAGGIAHDFNNLLGGIINASELIGFRIKDDEKVNYLNKLVIETAQRSGELINKLLAFAREKPPVMGTVELNGIIRDTSEVLKRTLNKNITLRENLVESELNILGDRSLLQSIIMNLCINASHAMPEGGEIYMETGFNELDETYCRMSQFDLKPGSFIRLVVEDTGTGIPKGILEKVFDPFFTTKEQGKGTGLGLSAVYGTVRQYNGEIKVYSEEGKGTSFHIFFPLSEAVENRGASLSKESVRGRGKILVVDDEETLRFTTKTLLEHLGYEVVTAENGEEALKKIDLPLDLVILDMNMPVMDGKTCLGHLKKRKPHLPVIIASGFSRNINSGEIGAEGFLKKPYQSYELSQLIHNILAKKESLN
ncbi:MAG: response regulator [Spirochaetales bacterium]|nr:response regulator [Spirochaetales bacterium]